MDRTNWDDDGPTLSANLRDILLLAQENASKRAPLTLELMRGFHAAMMVGLVPPNPAYAGCFRGDGAARLCEVKIGGAHGTPAGLVAGELQRFEERLSQGMQLLDGSVADALDSEDHLRAVLRLCAWVHSEWVRIHPFANGTGRTARLWVNLIAMRYGLPPFLRLRPRPQGRYFIAAAQAMKGNWRPSVAVFQRLLNEELGRP